MDAPIKHKGEIIEISGNRIDVKMTVEGACATCRVRTMCGMSESEDRVISIEDDILSRVCRIGDMVNISITESVGIKAVVYSYILPFFIMLVVLVGLSLLQENELLTGISTLVACALYYVCLYFYRGKLEKEIEFKIEKLTE